MKNIFYTLLLIAGFHGVALTATIYVDASATGANNGTSWADAYTTLSAALSEANTHTDADNILVAAGTYYPSGLQQTSDRDVAFGIFRGGIRIFGGYPSGGGLRDPLNHAVFLDGGIGTAAATDNSYHVVVVSGIPATADSVVIDGVIVRNGMADTNTFATYNGQTLKRSYGGGIAVTGANNGISVRNCIIENNFNESTWVQNPNANPTSPIQGFVDVGLGGGIYAKNASLHLYKCTLRNNHSPGSSEGAALYLSNNSSVISQCTFTGNKSGTIVLCNDNSVSRFLQCTFTGNGPEFEGWGSSVISSQMGLSNALEITGCLIAGNDGRAIDGAAGTVTNCTVTGNDAGYGNNTMPADPVHISNCILYGNYYNNVMTVVQNHLDVKYSLVGGGYSGAGNIDANPQFVDASNGNYHLLANSPAINTGNNAQAAGIAEDLDGNPRILNGTVDRGAYEFVGNSSSAGISTTEQPEIRIYPNPVASALHIDSPYPIDAIVFSTEGRMLVHQANALTIDLEILPAGFYILNLYNKNGSQTLSKQIVKY